MGIRKLLIYGIFFAFSLFFLSCKESKIEKQFKEFVDETNTLCFIFENNVITKKLKHLEISFENIESGIQDNYISLDTDNYTINDEKIFISKDLLFTDENYKYYISFNYDSITRIVFELDEKDDIYTLLKYGVTIRY